MLMTKQKKTYFASIFPLSLIFPNVLIVSNFVQKFKIVPYFPKLTWMCELYIFMVCFGYQVASIPHGFELCWLRPV